MHWYSEGGFLVRGTLDRHKALALAVADPEAESHGLVDKDDTAEWLAGSMYRWLKRARPGRYRVVPVNPYAFDGCTWRAWLCNPGGGRNQRGTFDAVEFTP